jgi:adenylate cyclase class 2
MSANLTLEPALNRPELLAKPTLDALTGLEKTLGAEALLSVLEGLGCTRAIEFSKQCSNYQWTVESGRSVLATVVAVPELDGTFIENETMAEESDTPAALDELRALLFDLAIPADALATELYTDTVARARSTS